MNKYYDLYSNRSMNKDDQYNNQYNNRVQGPENNNSFNYNDRMEDPSNFNKHNNRFNDNYTNDFLNNRNNEDNKIQNNRQNEINEGIASYYDRYINNFKNIQNCEDVIDNNSNSRNEEIFNNMNLKYNSQNNNNNNNENNYYNSNPYSNDKNINNHNNVVPNDINNMSSNYDNNYSNSQDCNKSNNSNYDNNNFRNNSSVYNKENYSSTNPWQERTMTNIQTPNNNQINMDNMKYSNMPRDNSMNRENINLENMNSRNKNLQQNNIPNNTSNNMPNNMNIRNEKFMPNGLVNRNEKFSPNNMGNMGNIENRGTPKPYPNSKGNKEAFTQNRNMTYDNVNTKGKNFSREYIDLSKNGMGNANLNKIDDKRNGRWGNRAKYIELDSDEELPPNLSQEHYNYEECIDGSQEATDYENCDDCNAYEMTCGYVYGRSPNSHKDVEDEDKIITLKDGTAIHYTEYDKNNKQCNFLNVNELGEIVKSNSIDVKVNKDDSVIRSDLIVEKTTIIRVWGKVKDSSGNPIAGAIVSILKPDDIGNGLEYQCCATTITDYMGFYEFEVENDYNDIVYRVVVNKCKSK